MIPIPIVILSYNTQAFLENCLKAIANNTYMPYRIYIFDNGSQDGSADFIRGLDGKDGVTGVLWDSNKGVSRGWNEAIAQIDLAEHVALLNTDCEVRAGWLSGLHDEMGDGMAVAASMLLIPHNPNMTIHAGGHPTIDGAHITGEVRKFPKPEKRVWVTFASVLLNRRIFQKLGGFNEEMFIYGQDREYCLRAGKAGYDVCFTPHSQVFHWVARSVKAMRQHDPKLYAKYVGK